MHKDRKQFDEPFNHKLFDNKIEEVVPVELMERLCLFAEGTLPNWGPNIKQWIDCEKVKLKLLHFFSVSTLLFLCYDCMNSYHFVMIL